MRNSFEITVRRGLVTEIKFEKGEAVLLKISA